jgi:hypothetical protein
MTNDDVYNMIAAIQDNLDGPVQNDTINTVVRNLNQLSRTLSNWVKSKKGGAAPESAPLVEMTSWPTKRYGIGYVGRPERPAFLDLPAPEWENAWPSFEEMFKPSGKTGITPAAVLAARKKLIKYTDSSRHGMSSPFILLVADVLTLRQNSWKTRSKCSVTPV